MFDTWVPGPCSPNGQAQGQCPPGELFRVRLVPVAEGLTNPRQLAFLPNGDLLIAELANRVRIVRDGKLDPQPLAGWPAAGIEATNLQAVAVHPQFAANRFVYLYYVKSDADARTTLALARAGSRARSSPTSARCSRPTTGFRVGRSRAAPCSGPTA